MHLRRLAVGCTAAFILACSGDDGGTGPDPQAIVTITPAADRFDAR